ncbi:hypothetical protein [Maricaulis salignorans]|uniref:Uncharacterized protein n=1 Tax=Maricaulis salignorans TaxID=144026 RepID=A0A1G9LK26_9PROT|nr:hypothetical protein [Maricaulis salignorans]SDL62280.1 hypothetical protein SAMN04488568_10188 [Maricaulis salignorans]
MQVVRWIVVILALGRVVYSLPYLLAAWTGDWLVPPLGASGPEILTAVQAVPDWLQAIWTAYMAGFLATAILLIAAWPKGIKLALLAAAAAVSLDLGYWIWIIAEPLYVNIDRPAFQLHDVIINIASLATLLGVAVLQYWPRRPG